MPLFSWLDISLYNLHFIALYNVQGIFTYHISTAPNALLWMRQVGIIIAPVLQWKKLTLKECYYVGEIWVKLEFSLLPQFRFFPLSLTAFYLLLFDCHINSMRQVGQEMLPFHFYNETYWHHQRTINSKSLSLPCITTIKH